MNMLTTGPGSDGPPAMVTVLYTIRGREGDHVTLGCRGEFPALYLRSPSLWEWVAVLEDPFKSIEMY